MAGIAETTRESTAGLAALRSAVNSFDVDRHQASKQARRLVLQRDETPRGDTPVLLNFSTQVVEAAHEAGNPDLLSAYALFAVTEGMQPRKVLSMLDEAVVEKTGNTFRERRRRKKEFMATVGDDENLQTQVKRLFKLRRRMLFYKVAATVAEIDEQMGKGLRSAYEAVNDFIEGIPAQVKTILQNKASEGTLESEAVVTTEEKDRATELVLHAEPIQPATEVAAITFMMPNKRSFVVDTLVLSQNLPKSTELLPSDGFVVTTFIPRNDPPKTLLGRAFAKLAKWTDDLHNHAGFGSAYGTIRQGLLQRSVLGDRLTFSDAGSDR